MKQESKGEKVQVVRGRIVRETMQSGKIGVVTMAKKRDKLFFNVSHSSNEKIIAKSMTVLKLFKRSSKWDHAGCCSFIRLEMTEG